MKSTIVKTNFTFPIKLFHKKKKTLKIKNLIEENVIVRWAGGNI
jgi:hypothetical protein